MKTCDFCGKEFSGESYPVYDENFILQEGVEQCEECYAESLGVTDEEK